MNSRHKLVSQARHKLITSVQPADLIREGSGGEHSALTRRDGLSARVGVTRVARESPFRFAARLPAHLGG